MSAAERRAFDAAGALQQVGGVDAVSHNVEWRGARPTRSPRRHDVRVERTLDRTIVPNLVRQTCDASAEHKHPVDHQAAVLRLTELVLQDDGERAAHYVEELGAKGLEPEELYIDVLAPTAQHLGQLWLEDRCDFNDVTFGVCRLQQALHAWEARLDEHAHPTAGGPRILLVPAPGEQHGFGLALVAALFRRARWDVWADAAATSSDCAVLLQRERFDVVGISVSRADRLDPVAELVRTIRRRSRNRGIGVLVGGQGVARDLTLADAVGADAAARDGRDALLRATEFLSPMAARSQMRG